MWALYVLLIPIRLVLKLVGFALAGVFKIIGFIVSAFPHVFGWITNILGLLLIGAAVLWTACGFMNVADIAATEYWWVTSLTVGGFGFLVMSLSLWIDLLGGLISGIGDWFCNNIGMMSLIPD